MIAELVCRTRSYRRFRESEPVTLDTLHKLVDLARLAPSAGNQQPLRYVLCCDRDTNAAIYPCLAWAGYLADWPGPAEGERPAAYVIVLTEKGRGQAAAVDEGLALQNLLLGAVEHGLGGCILGSVERDRVRAILDIPDDYDIGHVVALGVPAETVVLEEVGPDGDIKYWRDARSVHHVPKRRLADIIVGERG
ncbi:MAG: malonic semialdehyde reductase [Chloroflexi bacterium ADurb.Bin325]|nr:MAG: malonic semialdehyde reductase [Chloroflexi bacterium ADurb.Bin325]